MWRRGLSLPGHAVGGCSADVTRFDFPAFNLTDEGSAPTGSLPSALRVESRRAQSGLLTIATTAPRGAGLSEDAGRGYQPQPYARPYQGRRGSAPAHSRAPSIAGRRRADTRRHRPSPTRTRSATAMPSGATSVRARPPAARRSRCSRAIRCSASPSGTACGRRADRGQRPAERHRHQAGPAPGAAGRRHAGPHRTRAPVAQPPARSRSAAHARRPPASRRPPAGTAATR